MTNVIVAMPLSRVLIEDRISLYLLAVADSGERKTTCDAIFSPGLRGCEPSYVFSSAGGKWRCKSTAS